MTMRYHAPLVQRLGYEPSKLETRVRLPDGACDARSARIDPGRGVGQNVRLVVETFDAGRDF